SPLPVPKGRTDDAYFVPLEKLKLRPGTALYLGLIHHNDAEGDKARLPPARRPPNGDGLGPQIGPAGGGPSRPPRLDILPEVIALPKVIDHFAPLAPDYDVLLCDVWGVIHNGIAAFAPACEALMRFRKLGGTAILITNAP